MKIEVNKSAVEAEKGETILEVLKRIGIEIPTLCHMQDLFPTGACRMCVVELEGREGLVPSCASYVYEGMKIYTHSPKVLNARKTIVELLLANHPDDCLYCMRNKTCELQDLAAEFGIKQRRYSEFKKYYKLDISSPSIVRDQSKCILCGRCVRVCEEVMSVSAIDFVGRGSFAEVGTSFQEGMNKSSCINCGQCIRICPTGALSERNNLKEVINALADPKKHVVIQHAPAVSVTIGEYFGFPPGTDVAALMTAGLRKIGFDKVFDTSFSADLTIMEEASELVDRIKNNKPLPMFTSCSPAWVKFVEEFYPEFLPNISTCKSPQQMLGAIIKHYYADKQGIDPKNIYSVSIMPCTAKKFESQRMEHISKEGYRDVNAAITTRELAELFEMFHIDFNSLEFSQPDNPFGQRSSAGKLFGATGGVMEAAIRTAYYLLTGDELENLEISAVRDFADIKEATVDIKGTEVKVAVANGISSAKKILEDIKAGKRDYHFVEVMSCPGGCINGGGQPYGLDMDKVRSRLKALYNIDEKANLRVSHQNPSIIKLYKEFLGEPLSGKSHELLHTKYHSRDLL